MTRCLAPDCQMGGLGCDNMTVILVCFLHNGETYEKLAEKCRTIPSNNNNNNNLTTINNNNINSISSNDLNIGK
jgi:protein phosphatase 2C family protein 2/3